MSQVKLSRPQQQQMQQVDDQLSTSETATTADAARASFRRNSIDAAHDVSIGDWQIVSSNDVSLSSTTTIVTSSLRRRHSSHCRNHLPSQYLVSSTTNRSIRKKQARQDDSIGEIHLNEQATESEPIVLDDNSLFKKQTNPILDTAAVSASSTSRVKETIKRTPVWRSPRFQVLISLSLFSYLGEFSRYFFGELFGLACHNPQDVGWNALEWAPCTTASGTTESTGGAFFTDLPSNIIGCFLMGLLVTSDVETVAVNMPMAMLPRDAFFQRWTITHVGMRTGFCGSLTTFASWNTQMVVMVCGGPPTAIGSSQWVSALWGYWVGLFVSLQSFFLGRSIAVAFSRLFNPLLAKEADAIVDKKEIGILVNRDLPDFERRFLHDVILEEADPSHVDSTVDNSRPDLQQYGDDAYRKHFDEHIHYLQAWKESTQQHRHTSSPYAQLLQSIEKTLIVNREEPRQELLEEVRDAGWNVRALQNWLDATATSNVEEDEVVEEQQAFWNRATPVVEIGLTLFLYLLFTGLFVWGAVRFNGPDSISTNYRTQFLSALLSPFGTFVRWYLSSFNGSIKSKRWEWLPVGTLAANLIAATISALMQALIFTLEPDSHLARSLSEAIKVGFAGSLSTVSTFAAETIGLLRGLPRYFWGWYYSFGTLVLGLAVGLLSYSWALR